MRSSKSRLLGVAVVSYQIVLVPLKFGLLRPENLDEITAYIAHRTSRQILAAIKAAYLMAAFCVHTINCIVVAYNALDNFYERRLRVRK
jgi:hypothetical protein